MKALRKVVLGIGVAVLLVALHTGIARANLLINGGFETGDFTGWTLAGDQSWTSVSTAGNFAVAPQSGTYFAAFAGVSQAGGGNGDAILSQTLTTASGQSYNVHFWMASDGGTPNDFWVKWNGTTLLSLVNMNAQPWTSYNYTITGTGTDTLTFGIYK